MALLATDPVCFKRDANGNLKFPLELASGLEAIGILIRQRLLLFRGEWFLNLDAGIPYLPTEDGTTVTEADAILGQKFDQVKVRAAMLEEILTVPGVLDVPVFRLAFIGETRVLTITWVVKSRFGTSDVETLSREI